MKKNQTGATLIVVLVLLLVITIIGTLAIRQSLMSLNIVTNSQAQQLLVQNSDAALFNVEDGSNLLRNLARDGMFGYIRGDANKDKELVFCYRGDQSQFFSLANASIMQWIAGASAPTGSALGADGYCKSNSSDSTKNYFTSGRSVVMTQVAVKFASTESDPFQHSLRGTDTKNVKMEDTEKVVVFATSFIPSLSTASKADIDQCLSSKMNQVIQPSDVLTPATGATESVSACLHRLNVPYTTQVAEYTIAQGFT
ncbi:pilus assembly protein PilX [Acinetobacter sp. IRS14]|uniref:PilX N-terminal domain-containing pilus assembly protein n=1 Tax=Acinetobacter TaxID=469 RepID=UPI002AFE0181|nr:PilX N-terminal domain-containing pilus assembly protein [Acinetobacter sp. IRS14]MEA1230619.1 pilus assembly protein PilX [Acinetobacter sp. IRS14]